MSAGGAGASIVVRPREGGGYRVDLGGSGGGATHEVEVPAGLAGQLGWDGPGSEAELVRESFAFLLEREPATSILRRFSLEVIARYFPGYPAEMRRRAPGRS